jgi:hypothetical protein
MKKDTRPATPADFKAGTDIIVNGYEFYILRQYDAGIWEARGANGQGDTVIFESNAHQYQIKHSTQ